MINLCGVEFEAKNGTLFKEKNDKMLLVHFQLINIILGNEDYRWKFVLGNVKSLFIFINPFFMESTRAMDVIFGIHTQDCPMFDINRNMKYYFTTIIFTMFM